MQKRDIANKRIYDRAVEQLNFNMHHQQMIIPYFYFTVLLSVIL